MARGLMAGALLLLACTDPVSPGSPDALHTANLAKWNAEGPRSYEMVLSRSCGCTPEPEHVRVVVRNRAVESRTFVPGGAPVPAVRAGDFPDVPGLFAVVSEARRRNAFSWNATYDPAFGYPASIYVDFVGSGLEDNLAYQVTEFAPLPQP